MHEPYGTEKWYLSFLDYLLWKYQCQATLNIKNKISYLELESLLPIN